MLEKQCLLNQNIQRIVIVSVHSELEYLMCIVPALLCLRAAFPYAHITLIGLYQAPFVQRWHYLIDQFLEFPGYPGILESPGVEKIPEFLASVHASHFDLALQLHDNGIILNSFTSLLGARINAGFYVPGHFCPNPDYFIPYPEDQPEIWRHLLLMQYLGIPIHSDKIEFPLQEADFIELSKIKAAKYLLLNKYICIHPSALTQPWSLENFASVADDIAERGYHIVLIGTATDANLTTAVASIMKTKPINLAGKISIGAMAVLLVHACLVICGNTIVSQLATALDIKSVVILNCEAERWAPLNHQLHRVLTSEYNITSTSEWIGSSSETSIRSSLTAKLAVTPTMVMTQVEDLLR